MPTKIGPTFAGFLYTRNRWLEAEVWSIAPWEGISSVLNSCFRGLKEKYALNIFFTGGKKWGEEGTVRMSEDRESREFPSLGIPWNVSLQEWDRIKETRHLTHDALTFSHCFPRPTFALVESYFPYSSLGIDPRISYPCFFHARTLLPQVFGLQNFQGIGSRICQTIECRDVT